MDQHISTPDNRTDCGKFTGGRLRLPERYHLWPGMPPIRERNGGGVDLGERNFLIPIQNATIYYIRPSPRREGRPNGSASPTHGQQNGHNIRPDCWIWVTKAMVGKESGQREVLTWLYEEIRRLFCRCGRRRSSAVQKVKLKQSEIVC